MKTALLKKRSTLNPFAQRHQAILQEQLALRRLKELEKRHRKKWDYWLILRVLFRRAELTREVGPHHAPLESHDWREKYARHWHQIY